MHKAFIKYYCVISKILKFIPNSGLSRFPLGVSVFTIVGQTPALQQNWQSSEKSKHFKEKTQKLMNTM